MIDDPLARVACSRRLGKIWLGGVRPGHLGSAVNPVEALIQAEIEAGGAIPFARFMELALYAPGAGYYERDDRAIGRRGDFYTSVSVGPVFGFLLAAWIAEVGMKDDVTGIVEIVEAGAHDGQLAGDILTALDRFHPRMANRVRYGILEPSASRRRVQAERLSPWGDRVRWWTGWSERDAPVRGVILTNELLDAFPVRRFGWEASGGTWFEWGVCSAPGRFATCRLALPPDDPEAPAALPAGLAALVPDGFTIERCPAAGQWWAAAARSLEAGWLVAFDYGDEDGDALRPERPGGTARAYWQHRLVNDLLARPGEQDLTAHVDFGALRTIGEAAGLKTEACLPQGRWLGAVAVRVLERGGPAAGWLQDHARQLQTLTHPTHLGAALKVLEQQMQLPS